ncbi:MAG: hypothetical protein AB8B63_12915 [Granulosicoccus sp.]
MAYVEHLASWSAKISRHVFLMYDQNDVTELKLRAPLPRDSLLWLAAVLLIAVIYGFRGLVDDIPPQDHVALAMILIVMLTQVLITLEQNILIISLSKKRAWVMHHQMGRRYERSLPLSVIHSAQLQFDDKVTAEAGSTARIVLVTSLGMIPMSGKFNSYLNHLQQSSEKINAFLKLQERYLSA